MRDMLKQARDLGKLITTKKELGKSLSDGKKVLIIISGTCTYCKALMDSWSESKELMPYLTYNQIKLLFIEKGLSLELSQEMKRGGYPTVLSYKNGRLNGWEFTQLYADPFIEWLKEQYSN
jgi:hypothetical protein